MFFRTRAFYFILTVFLASSLFFTSCSDDTDSPTDGGNTDPLGQIKCDIDGVSWNGTGVLSNSEVDGKRQINIVGNLLTDVVSLYLVDPKVGENIFSDDLGNIGGITINNTAYTVKEGSIVLTKITETEAEGTFEFIAVPMDISNPDNQDPITITNGSFDVKTIF